MPNTFIVRKARVADAVELLKLMKELAQFEHYLDQYNVTENDLIERGLRDHQNRQFTAFLAVDDEEHFLGYAVVYLVPFTFDLHPNLILKELYVTDIARGIGVGHALMSEVTTYARTCDCRRIKWDVLPTNELAKKFYRSIGGKPEMDWENWIRQIDADLPVL